MNSVYVLVLNLSAQSQDLCCGDTFSSDDQRDELQELQRQAREDWIDYFIVPHKLQAS